LKWENISPLGTLKMDKIATNFPPTNALLADLIPNPPPHRTKEGLDGRVRLSAVSKSMAE
jgi:hypothetical protein